MTYTGTKADCQTLATLGNKTAGYPLVGVHVGGGVHVPMPPTWDGVGEVPPGWTAYSDQSIAPTADGKAYTIPIDPTLDATSTKLTTTEKTTLTTTLAAGTVTLTAATVDEVIVP